MTRRIAILLGAYGPAPFLAAQLESLAAQSHSDWTLLISFDGESAAARAQAERFITAQPEREVHLLDGPNMGLMANYLHLLDHVAPEADYVAFCDHDDVWLSEKLARNLAQIEGIDGPAMTCGRTRICTETLAVFAESPDFQYGPSFGNSLLQSLGGANTMMINRKALSLLLEAKPHATRAVAHDRWAYQVLSGIGAQIIYDPEPQVLYRQHDGNTFGANATLRARISRVRYMFQGRLKDWFGRTVESLWPLRDLLTPENARALAAFAEARNAGMWRRAKLMRKAGVFRQTRAQQALFWLAVLLGKV